MLFETLAIGHIAVTQEIELKLDVDPDNLPLVRQDPIFARAESHSLDQVTVYYDTPETKLKKHGFTLRVRSAGGRFVQTVKPLTDNVGLVSREEIEFEVRSLKPDLRQLSDHPIHRLLARGEAKRLKPIIRCDVNRTSWQIGGRSGRMQIDFDHGMHHGRRTHSRIRGAGVRAGRWTAGKPGRRGRPSVRPCSGPPRCSDEGRARIHARGRHARARHEGCAGQRASGHDRRGSIRAHRPRLPQTLSPE